jgi:ABC-type nickel/cobalt efflux system permease component RcnA
MVRWGWLLACLAFAVFASLIPREAQAHPLGNFTINHYSRLQFTEENARITYVLDFAEIPTLQQKARLDANGDGKLSEEEANAYLEAEMPSLVEGLRLRAGDEILPLEVLHRSAEYRSGQGGLPTLRVETHLLADLPKDWRGEAHYADKTYENRLGWREIVVRDGPGVAIKNPTVPTKSVSNELRSYPQDMLSSPPDVREATFTLVPGDGLVEDETAGRTAERVGTSFGGVTGRVDELVSVGRPSAAVIALSMLAAFFWGAAHALTPGHGKAVVAAYLIGARGTARHAGILGMTVTLTHTAGVFILGAVTLYLSRYILPEVLYPWLSVASGVLVVLIGLTLLYRHLDKMPHGSKAGHTHADHTHPHNGEHSHAHHTHSHHGEHSHVHHTHSHGGHTHSHLPADGSKVTWRGLMALGVSGGLVPCPAALVLLLGAISLDRLGFGMVLVLAFSAGLAVVLTGIGLLMIYARKLFERFSFEARVPRLLPIVSASVITLAGLGIALGALGQTGIV